MFNHPNDGYLPSEDLINEIDNFYSILTSSKFNLDKNSIDMKEIRYFLESSYLFKRQNIINMYWRIGKIYEEVNQIHVDNLKINKLIYEIKEIYYKMCQYYNFSNPVLNLARITIQNPNLNLNILECIYQVIFDWYSNELEKK